MSNHQSAEVRKSELLKLRGSRFISYPAADNIIAQLEDLLRFPRVHRMPNLLIVGETNNGKSMIVNRFLARHRAELHVAGSTSKIPVLVVQAPNVPDEGRFYNAILTSIYAPFRASARIDQRQAEVIRLLDLVGTKILIIDEIHNILAGSSIKQRQFRNAIRYLGNELRIPIVGVGTRDAHFAVQADKQLENRFDVFQVKRWTLSTDFLRLLASFEVTLKLQEASNLTHAPLAEKLLALSEGTIGELARLLVAAATRAIELGREKIDVEMLNACGYVSPSERPRFMQ